MQIKLNNELRTYKMTEMIVLLNIIYKNKII